MKIASVDAIPLSIAFSHGGPPAGIGGGTEPSLDFVLVRVETDDGLVGYGEAFSYRCRSAVVAALRDMVAPIAVGADAGAIASLNHRLQRELHLFGRYGITMFAISGLDIALWDIAGKAAGLPLHRLLGGARSGSLPGYASLLRLEEPDLVQARCRRAVDEGYRFIKLHEVSERAVAAAREAVGDEVELMIDTNCPWTLVEATDMAARFEPYRPYWLEEPVFPPDDFVSLAELSARTSISLASGENLCTSFQFAQMFAAGGVRYAQPSVTKVGGVTELARVAAMAPVHGVSVMPHSPYFGPGFLATLHFMATLEDGPLVERFHLDAEAWLYPDWVNPVAGGFRLPGGPGLGAEPDPAVIERFRVPY